MTDAKKVSAPHESNRGAYSNCGGDFTFGDQALDRPALGGSEWGARH